MSVQSQKQEIPQNEGLFLFAFFSRIEAIISGNCLVYVCLAMETMKQTCLQTSKLMCSQSNNLGLQVCLFAG